jgi:serine/threonine protein phosphatase PrpC
MTGQLVLEWASAGAGLDGGVSGDAHVVAAFPGGALVALIDGLGHGPEAAEAARAAAHVLEAFAADPVPLLLTRCHEALRRTRGAVMSLASFDAAGSSMTWAGVGNVEALLLRGGAGPAREGLTPRGGVVGYQFPPPRATVVPVAPGDTLVMATDGIRSEFVAGLAALASKGGPRELADSIFARHARVSDDALVVVARYRGAAE